MWVRSWIRSHMTNVCSVSFWSSSSRPASSGSSSLVISDAARTTRRNLAASRSAKIAPQVNVGTSRIATLSGKSTAEFVSYPAVKSRKRTGTNSLFE